MGQLKKLITDCEEEIFNLIRKEREYEQLSPEEIDKMEFMIGQLLPRREKNGN